MFFSIIVGILIIGIYPNLRAQDVCRMRTVKLDRVQGQIFLDPPTNDDAEVTKSQNKLTQEYRLELVALEKPESRVGSATADDDGYFAVEGVRKGKYRLRAYYYLNGENVIPYYDLILKIRKTNKVKSSKYVRIDLETDCNATLVSILKKALDR